MAPGFRPHVGSAKNIFKQTTEVSAGVNHSTSGSSYTVTVIVAFIRLVTLLQAFAVMPVARGLFCDRSNLRATIVVLKRNSETKLRVKFWRQNKSCIMTVKRDTFVLIVLLFTCAQEAHAPECALVHYRVLVLNWSESGNCFAQFTWMQRPSCAGRGEEEECERKFYQKL